MPEPQDRKTEEDCKDKQPEAVEGWYGVSHDAISRDYLRRVRLAVSDADCRRYDIGWCGERREGLDGSRIGKIR